MSNTRTETVRNPFTGEAVGSVPVADEREVEEALAAAHETFQTARRQTPDERARVLERVAAGVREHEAEFVELIIAEAGKPRRSAEAEVARAQQTFSLAAREALEPRDEPVEMEASAPGRGHTGWVRRVPRGVILGVTPFNFPLNLVAHKVAPCLATGNTMLLKPAPKAPLSAVKLAGILRDAGVPPEQVRVLLFDHALVPRLLADERIKMLSFTGSSAVGWDLKSRSGKKPVTLELGGNAAVIVHDDAAWRDAAPLLARSAFGFAGQSCISVQRIFVQEKIHAEFREAFVDYTKSHIRTGDPRDAETVVGPMIEAAARDRVLEWVGEAVSRGARALTPVAHRGNCIEPIILENVPHDAKVSCEEVFGPVALIEPYADFEDALRAVNDSRYGLQAGVFTRDLALAQWAFDALEVGGVLINQTPTFRVENMPYGGVKDSGFGREGIRYAMEEMCERRLCIVRHA